jgi:hypothetical protein
MSFELPDLDTATSALLQAQLVRRIPQFTTRWTDFNDSDPGITLLQLLCWIGESLGYQANTIPLETQQNFLRWVLGLAFSTTTTPYSRAAEQQYDLGFLALRSALAAAEQGAALTASDLQQAVLSFIAKPYPALTLGDVERRVLETNQIIDIQQETHPVLPAPVKVLRADAYIGGEAITAAILPDIPWTYRYPPYANPTTPDTSGLLRALLLYQPPADATGTAARGTALLQAVTTALAPRVLLGNRIIVALARLTDVNVRAAVRCPAAMRLDVVLATLTETLFAYFQPATGGEGAAGWVYGRPPRLDDIAALIGATPGVEAIERLEMDFIPTIKLPGMAELGANTLLADMPPEPPAMIYRGLPRLRCLDLRARSAAP